MVTLETIDLTPTTDEYQNLAIFFATAVLDDAKDSRRTDTAKLLESAIGLVAYLATVPDGAARIAAIKAAILGGGR